MDRVLDDSNAGDGRLTAIFAKCPRPGQVKTRLSPPFSPEEAAALAQAMLLDVGEELAGAGAFRTAIVFAPAGEAEWFRESLPWIRDQRAQRGEGLGQRLERFFAEAFIGGIESVVVVGSDQPWMSSARVLAAHRALERGADLVIGPDEGGGYDLVGLGRPEGRLFREVEMSTDGMSAATVSLARSIGMRAELLDAVYDVDVAADVERLSRDLAKPREGSLPRRTQALLHAWGKLSTEDMIR